MSRASYMTKHLLADGKITRLTISNSVTREIFIDFRIVCT